MIKKSNRWHLSRWGLGLLLLASSSQARALELTGNAKTYGIVSQQKDLFVGGKTNYSLLWSARIGSTVELKEEIEFTWAYGIQGTQHSLSPSVPQETEPAYRTYNTEQLYLAEDHRQIVDQNLDRFHLTYTTEQGRLVFGRQPIWFGVGRIANPTDVFVPIPFGLINPEYRFGIDAIKYTHSLGELSELELGYLFGKDFDSDNNAFFVRSKTVIHGLDVEGIAIDFLSAQLLGLNLQTSLGGVGIFSETAHINPENGDTYIGTTFGGSYMFDNEWLVNSEFHYNGAGETSIANYILNFQKFAYMQGGVRYLATRYASIGASKAVHPLWTLAGDLIYNGDDKSSLMTGTVNHSLSDESVLIIGCIWNEGSSAGSEFRQYPKQLYLNYSHYF